MGIWTKGMGAIMKKFSKKVPKKTVTTITDDGGPYVRMQKFNAKKAKEKGTISNKSGHVVGTPNKERSAESIKKYHGIK
jgi:hypothetical protein